MPGGCIGTCSDYNSEHEFELGVGVCSPTQTPNSNWRLAMPALRLSLGQMDIALGNVDANFERVREWTAEAAQNGSSLVVFPELWSTGYDLENWRRYASPLGEGMFAHLSDLAHEFRIAIAGSILEARDGKAYNTLALFDAEGKQQAVYRKVHLFRLMAEDKWLAPGEESVVANAA